MANEPAPTLKRVTSKQQYESIFSSKRKAALDRAHDIRKFEIELYWKRATYFWAFTAAALVGYLSMGSRGDQVSSFLICCLGFLFSLSWYLVNRGSSFWQRNWEAHVDLLEDEEEGPLHKSVINRDRFKFSDLTEAYRFSPARTNTALSLLFVLLWILLAAKTGFGKSLPLSSGQQMAVLIFVSLVTAVQMIRKGRTGRRRQDRSVNFVTRDYS